MKVLAQRRSEGDREESRDLQRATEQLRQPPPPSTTSSQRSAPLGRPKYCRLLTPEERRELKVPKKSQKTKSMGSDFTGLYSWGKSEGLSRWVRLVAARTLVSLARFQGEGGSGGGPRPRWLYSGVTTPIKNGRRFLTPLICVDCLLTGWEAVFSRAERSRNPPDLPEQAVSNLVSRQPAKTSGVRKRLPFSLCIRPEVSTPL